MAEVVDLKPDLKTIKMALTIDHPRLPDGLVMRMETDAALADLVPGGLKTLLDREIGIMAETIIERVQEELNKRG
jgi:hypothetical protein